MAPAQLPKRALGKDGPQVVSLGFGLMGLASAYGNAGSDEDRFKLLDRAYELGATNWDSADAYGDNEDLVGKWFERTGKRSEIFLATKFGNVHNPGSPRVVKNDPSYVQEACEKSLSRLGIETIDLYYCHRFNGEVPVEDIVGAMAELVNQGKVRHIGLSECSAATLRRAHAVHPIAAVQLEYSPFAMQIEDPQIDLLRTCCELGVAIVAYSPLGRGFLTGQYRSPDDLPEGDLRRISPRFSAENFPNNIKLVDTLKAIADKKGCTPGQLTLAWLLHQGEDIIPIPGTKRISSLEENMAALTIMLSDEENSQIRRAVEVADIKGGRYPVGMGGMLLADTPEKK